MQGSNNTVNLGPNWAVVQAFLVAIGHDVEMFLLLLPTEVAEVCRKVSAVLEKGGVIRYSRISFWRHHDSWLEVEKALVKRLGHWDHLREVGRASARVAFGFDAIGAWFTRRITRWITDPDIGYKLVGNIARSYQVVKEMVFVPLKRGEGRILMIHNRAILNPTRDFGSLRLICGYGDGVPALWRQKGLPPAELSVIAVNPVEVIRAWARGSTATIEGGHFYINMALYGRVVYVVPDPNGIVLDTATRNPGPTPGAIPVIEITRDFLTPCGMCKADGGQPASHAIMLKGQLWECSPDHPLKASVFRVYWRSSRIGRFIGRRLGLEARAVQEFVVGIENEAELGSALREADVSHDQVGELTAEADQHYPNGEIARDVRSGQFRGRTVLQATLYTDLPDYTSTTAGLTAEARARWIDDALGEAVEAIQAADGWTSKFVGDCIMGVFAPGFHQQGQEWTIQESALGAIEAGARFLRGAARFSWAPRVGLHVGSVHWRMFGGKLEGNGEGIDSAQRLETEAAEHGSMAASREFIQAAYPDATFEGIVPGESRIHGWTYAGEQTFKGGFKTMVFTMRVADNPSFDQIEAARRSYASLPAMVTAVPDPTRR